MRVEPELRPGRWRLLVIEPGHALHDVLSSSGAAPAFELTEVDSMAGALAALAASHPDLLLLDLDVEADIGALCAQSPESPVVVVTSALSEQRIVVALKAGASGCLLRQDLLERLVPAIYDALAGGAPMSREVARVVLERARRQSSQMCAVRPGSVPPPPAPDAVPELGARKQEVLEMLSRGLSYEQIALGLGISVNTVRTHVREIYDRLGACTKVEAVLTAVQQGILPRR